MGGESIVRCWEHVVVVATPRPGVSGQGGLVRTSVSRVEVGVTVLYFWDQLQVHVPNWLGR